MKRRATSRRVFFSLVLGVLTMAVWADEASGQSGSLRRGCEAGSHPERSLQDGTFYMVHVATGKVLDVSGGQCNNANNIHLWTRNGSLAQQFRRGPNNSIINLQCNKAVDVNQASCADGTNIQLWDANGSGAQSFTFRTDGAIVNTACGNKVVDVDQNGVNDGTNLHLYQWNGSGAQIWRIDSIGGNESPSPPPVPPGSSDSLFSIVHVATGKVLDVSGGQCNNANNIHLWTSNGSLAQQFRRGPNNSIINIQCNKAVDVNQASCADGTNIQLWDANGSGAQSFTFRTDGAIVNTACGNKVIDVNQNGVTDGTNLHLYQWNGSGAQIWRIDSLEASVGSPEWEGPFLAPLIGSAAAALPDGRILLWSAYAKYGFGGPGGYTWTTIFDPSDKSFAESVVTNTGHDMFCPGLAFLGNGQMMVTGGSNSEKSSIYSPRDNNWVSSVNMNIPRGYHSMATLSNGDVFAIGGSWSGIGQGNRNGELWSNGVWHRKDGVLSDSMVTDDVNPKNRDFFMWIFQAPNGRIFKAGPSKMMHWIDVEGNGGFEAAGFRANDDDAMNGNAVMYDIGKILTVGGSVDFESGSGASPRSYVIDINGNTAIASQSGTMARARTFANSVVLPTGDVVVVGGKTDSVPFSDANAIYEAEIWSPNSGAWSLAGSMQIPRVYHATALLARDGTIVVAGGGLCGDRCGANHPDVEIFTPPYLRNVSGRPSIQVVSKANIAAGEMISVTMATNEAFTFAMVRTSAVTHSTNLDQRRIPLSIVGQAGNSVQLKVPDNPNVVIPGPYFLFAMDAAGTPSVGATMYVLK